MDISLETFYSLVKPSTNFSLCVHVVNTKINRNYNAFNTCYQLIWSFFKKQRSGNGLPWVTCIIIFEEKYLWWTKFHCLLVFTSWDICILIICFPVYAVIHFEINIGFLSNRFTHSFFVVYNPPLFFPTLFLPSHPFLKYAQPTC